jgi:hypothetical protein
MHDAVPAGPRRRVATGLERRRRPAAGARPTSGHTGGGRPEGRAPAWTRITPPAPGPLYGGPVPTGQRDGRRRRRTAPSSRPHVCVAARPCVGRAARATARSRIDGIHVLEQRVASTRCDPPGSASPPEHTRSASQAATTRTRRPSLGCRASPAFIQTQRAQAGRAPPRRNGDMEPTGRPAGATCNPHSTVRTDPSSNLSDRVDRGPEQASPRHSGTATRNLSG